MAKKYKTANRHLFLFPFLFYDMLCNVTHVQLIKTNWHTKLYSWENQNNVKFVFFFSFRSFYLSVNYACIYLLSIESWWLMNKDVYNKTILQQNGL